jgi:hypothetical protein
VVKRSVACDAEDPCREGNLARLIPLDRSHQVSEDLLGDVPGIVQVAHDAVHIGADIVSKSDVEEVKGACIAFLGARHGQSDEFRVLHGDRLSHDALLW